MRLVIRYHVGDGCTWGATEIVPVEYESAEAFVVEFEEFCRANQREFGLMAFAGKQWDPDNFFYKNQYVAPEILTVDEWFSEP